MEEEEGGGRRDGDVEVDPRPVVVIIMEHAIVDARMQCNLLRGMARRRLEAGCAGDAYQK
jgi:hypothetical protein